MSLTTLIIIWIQTIKESNVNSVNFSIKKCIKTFNIIYVRYLKPSIVDTNYKFKNSLKKNNQHVTFLRTKWIQIFLYKTHMMFFNSRQILYIHQHKQRKIKYKRKIYKKKVKITKKIK